ncbi:hypothetical protein CLAFUW4_04275 [Fulvia fulva]|uniref:Uncharacterized protein n=1 Tax=Passalora fulva TaxID=5499 RepID=A0A9Q8P861_PASFU|nr:uncharacterized protein CLAFUR5_04240 [Fulvia fulva]KAK4626856.1 hypothetical protein CLAFUR4_04261 [Fulvia fulva]KAK4628317.1 hypothetical protein CLAFUR0_04263 [Fulvia fulva]UJO16753.1 hypothetical protein CLAFUR5_04240 [Fulvia fulva]WPV14031.1 hypothetical protein CLAFUW4_04275 [Fulvia fulva]WPV29005.1 hypothetical protein CLAFUW7_04264 [Fulvia fulva]
MFGFSSSSNSKRPKLNGPDIASMTSPGPKYKDLRGYNAPIQPAPAAQPHPSTVTYNPNASTPETRAAAGLKWGVTPKDDPPPYSPPESSYSEEEQAERERLRKKGINPDLKAEMDEVIYGKGEDGKKKKSGFWTKVAGTSMGGGWIK